MAEGMNKKKPRRLLRLLREIEHETKRFLDVIEEAVARDAPQQAVIARRLWAALTLAHNFSTTIRGALGEALVEPETEIGGFVCAYCGHEVPMDRVETGCVCGGDRWPTS